MYIGCLIIKNLLHQIQTNQGENKTPPLGCIWRCSYYMRDLRRIRRHLDLDGAKLLATALVSSRLDHCNSHLHDIADIDLTRLQCIQNQLSCLVTKSPPFTRSLPFTLLRSLHWLPVRFRILFKIKLLTYKTLREKQCLSSLRACHIDSFPFTEIKQR